MDFNEEEIVKTKSKMYVITTFSVIGVIILFVLIFIFSINSTINDVSKKTYYVLDVTDKNKNEVIDLLEQEKENMFYNNYYCDSIYKIEYYNMFPDGTEYTIYCKEEDNINFGIDKVGEDVLATYIYNKGYIEKK